MIFSKCVIDLTFVIMCSLIQMSFCRPVLSDSKTESDINYLIGLGNSLEWGVDSNISVSAEHKLLKRRMSHLDLNELYDKCNYLNNMVEISNRYVFPIGLLKI